MQVEDYVGMGKKKDATAQGVAKIRHIETLFQEPGNERLFEDPYAHKMYPGASIVACLGYKWLKKLLKGINGGVTFLLTGRTTWLDQEVILN